MKSRNYTKNDTTKLLAFCALILSAVIWVLLALGVNAGILHYIKDIFVFLAIAIPAYAFARSLGRTWITIYWIIVGVFIAGIVLNIVL